MNIAPHAPSLSIPTVSNLSTETLRRENNQREVIAQPAAASQSAAEKGVASDKERGRTPAQNNEQIDFVSLKDKAEKESKSISEQSSGENSDQNQEKNQEQKPEQSALSKSPGTATNANEQEKGDAAAEAKAHFDEVQQEQVINELQHRDREVRNHELAHASVGGASTGSPSYTFQIGPDGKKYAVGGEVSVDLSTVSGDPKATIAKMQKVHAAALAPANPSTQDTRVAASATQIILQAQSELLSMQEGESAEIDSVNARFANTNEVLASEQQIGNESKESDFDAFINQTLKAQDNIIQSEHTEHNKNAPQNTLQTPSQSVEVLQRAGRIEHFYADITHAHNKQANYQFELTA
ncbi:MAG: putative metalloprotease CJM1_0395 family protein [Colwellia sp.]